MLIEIKKSGAPSYTTVSKLTPNSAYVWMTWGDGMSQAWVVTELNEPAGRTSGGNPKKQVKTMVTENLPGAGVRTDLEAHLKFLSAHDLNEKRWRAAIETAQHQEKTGKAENAELSYEKFGGSYRRR
jgi:hypothetical protein